MGILRILRLKRRFSKISEYKREDVEAIQRENIEKTLSHAMANSPFYKEYYGDGPRFKGDSEEPLSSVPFVDNGRGKGRQGMSPCLPQHTTALVDDRRRPSPSPPPWPGPPLQE